MAFLNEKAPSPPPQLLVKTPRVTEKASHDTMASANTLTAGAEKNGRRGSADMPRSSDVSSPVSNHLNPFDTDIEAIITPSTTTGGNSARRSLGCKIGGASDCQVWPGRDHWKQKAKAAKVKRSWGCLSHLSRRNRLIAKILIILLIVGIAVAVGFGVSKPLGAAIWQPHT